MASFAQQIPIPRAVWYVDDPANMANIPFHPHDCIFAASDRFVPEILKRGRAVTGVLQAAAPLDLAPPERCGEWRWAVSYVGSVADNRRILDELPGEIRLAVEQAVADMLASPLDSDIRQRISDRFTQENAAVFLKALSSAIPKSRFMTPDRLIPYFIYTEANTRRRVEAIALLEEIDSLAIYGPPDWRALLPSERLKKAYRGSIDSRDDLLDLYRSSQINLCFNSLQGFGFINSRVFDVPAAGGFILAEWAPVLSQVFEETRECVWFRTFSEMRELINRYRDREEERVAIVRQAQNRIRFAHTYQHRAQQILDALGE